MNKILLSGINFGTGGCKVTRTDTEATKCITLVCIVNVCMAIWMPLRR